MCLPVCPFSSSAHSFVAIYRQLISIPVRLFIALNASISSSSSYRISITSKAVYENNAIF
jgi:hypothetical protein